MKLHDVMTTELEICPVTTPLADAATTMRDCDIGDVLVRDENGSVCGIVTDRDLVVRGLAGHSDPTSLTLGDVCAKQLHTVDVDAGLDDVVKLMEDKALRRVPVMGGDDVVGIVSLGDLAEALDRESALGQISAARPD